MHICLSLEDRCDVSDVFLGLLSEMPIKECTFEPNKRRRKIFVQNLKVPKCEIFDRSDLHDFYTK